MGVGVGVQVVCVPVVANRAARKWAHIRPLLLQTRWAVTRGGRRGLVL